MTVTRPADSSHRSPDSSYLPDAHCGSITGPDVVYATLADVVERIGGANPVTGPIATHRGPVRVPYRPFIVAIGIAPAGEPVLAFQQRSDILGNVDLAEVRAGSTIVLRAALAKIDRRYLVPG